MPGRAVPASVRGRRTAVASAAAARRATGRSRRRRRAASVSARVRHRRPTRGRPLRLARTLTARPRRQLPRRCRARLPSAPLSIIITMVTEAMVAAVAVA